MRSCVSTATVVKRAHQIFTLTHQTNLVFSCCSYSILQVVQDYRSQQILNLISQKDPLEKLEWVRSGDWFGQELDNHQPKDHSATAIRKSCRLVVEVWWRSVMFENKVNVCFRAAIALITTLNITVGNSIKCLTQNRIPFCLCRETNGVHIKRYRVIYSFIHSFHWRVQNATIPCRSQELLPFRSVM
jgi:hypothetical protein